MLNICRSTRRRTAILLVFLYAFCVLSPHAAVAFIDAKKILHCLEQTSGAHHTEAADDIHAGDMAHQHGSGTNEENTQNSDAQRSAALACCGLFYSSGLAPEYLIFGRTLSSGERISGVAPDDSGALWDHHINRPPIV